MAKKQSAPAEKDIPAMEPMDAELEKTCETPDAVAEEKPVDPEVCETPEPSAEEKLLAELAETKDRYLRICAEYDNYRKRTQKEKEALYGDAVAKTVETLLPVIDNLSRAVDGAGVSEDLSSFKQGV